MKRTSPFSRFTLKYASLGLMILGSAAFSSALAAADYQVAICDNCSGSSYSHAAVRVGCPNEDDVYVVNRPDSVIKTFGTLCSYHPEFTHEKAYAIDPDPMILEDVNNALSFYRALLGTWSVDAIDLPGVGPGIDSAIDLAAHTPNQRTVAEGIAQWAIIEYLPSPLPEETEPIFQALPNTVTVEFPNGSYYDFDLKSVTFNDSKELRVRYELVPGSGVDAAGEAIPETPFELFDRSGGGGGGLPTDNTALEYGGAGGLASRLGVSVGTECSTTTTFECERVGTEIICTLTQQQFCSPGG